MATVVWPGGMFGTTNPTLFPAGTYVLEISGTPTLAGSYPVTVEMQDSVATKRVVRQTMVVEP
jgi:hypothetical protein